jgi:hypothetical protein
LADAFHFIDASNWRRSTGVIVKAVLDKLCKVHPGTKRRKLGFESRFGQYLERFVTRARGLRAAWPDQRIGDRQANQPEPRLGAVRRWLEMVRRHVAVGGTKNQFYAKAMKPPIEARAEAPCDRVAALAVTVEGAMFEGHRFGPVPLSTPPCCRRSSAAWRSAPDRRRPGAMVFSWVDKISIRPTRVSGVLQRLRGFFTTPLTHLATMGWQRCPRHTFGTFSIGVDRRRRRICNHARIDTKARHFLTFHLR